MDVRGLEIVAPIENSKCGLPDNFSELKLPRKLKGRPKRAASFFVMPLKNDFPLRPAKFSA